MVKMITVIGMVLLVGAIMFIFSGLQTEFDEYYIDGGISDSEKLSSNFTEGLDKTMEVNESFEDVTEAIETIGSAQGWWELTIGTLETLPRALISLPIAIFKIFALGVSQMSNMAQDLNIPSELVLIGVVFLSIVAVFISIAFIRRYNDS